MRKLLLCAVAVIASACANRPESIRASYVAHEKFEHLTCEELVDTLSGTRSQLERLSKQQDEKATGDAIGVFLFGVPFSKLSGDYEGDIARLKGEIEAIETAQVRKRRRCGGEAGAAGDSNGAPGSDLEARLQLLLDLRAKDMISEVEFNAKRLQLIDAALASGTQVEARAASTPTLLDTPRLGRQPAVDALRPGDRLRYRDADGRSGVMVGEVLLTVHSIERTQIVFNDGAVVLGVDGTPSRGSVATPWVYGVPPRASSGVGRIKVNHIREDVPIDFSFAGTETRTISGRTFNAMRFRLSGFASPDFVPGITSVQGGASVKGEMLIDSASGLLLEMKLSSINPLYTVRRSLQQVVP